MSLLDEARNHALSDYHTTSDSNQERQFSLPVIGNETSEDMNMGLNGTGILEAMYQPPPPSEHLDLSWNFSNFVVEPGCLPGVFSDPSDDRYSKDLPALSILSESSMQDGSDSSIIEASSFRATQTDHNLSSKECHLSDEMEFFNSMWETDPNFLN